ncbi:hypothetical protein [Nocardia sp. CNY236]|uniref:hypothetical protein n=1 Tax=Nocardia sp. CNY236 TaxID=1169152 RepID=UPI000411CD78|nr:hypothetical protein [Nocardia sp. CNY236]
MKIGRRRFVTEEAISDCIASLDLSELFEVWIATKDRLKPQSRADYRSVWSKHGESQLGALRIRELSTSRAERHIASLPVSRARMLRVVLVGMFSTAVRYDVLAVNPIREVSRRTGKKVPARALTAEEFAVVRSTVPAERGPGAALVRCRPDGGSAHDSCFGHGVGPRQGDQEASSPAG